MNRCKCRAAALIAALLLPSAAAGADPAAEAYQEGVTSLDKQDYDAAVTAFDEAIRLDPKNAAAHHHGVSPTGTRANTTRRLPISPGPSGSIQVAPRLTTIAASHEK